MATKASRIALAGSNISSTGEVDADLLDNIDSAAFLSLDSNGRLGIGVTNPAEKLHIRDSSANADVYIKIANDSRDWFMGVEGSNSDILSFKTHDASNLLNITSTGNLGIGDSSPTSRLSISKGSARTTDFENMLKITHTSSGTTGVGFGSAIYFLGERNNGVVQGMGRLIFDAEVNSGSDISSGFSVQTATAGSPSEKFRITHDGNVGIGTTTPQHDLVVQNDNGPIISLIGQNYNDQMGIVFNGGDQTNASSNGNTGAKIISQIGLNGGQVLGDLSFTVNSGDTFVESIKINNSGISSFRGGHPNVNGSSSRVYDVVVNDGIAIGDGGYTHGYVGTNGTDGDVYIAANAYPANLGADRNVIIATGSPGGGGPNEVVRYNQTDGVRRRYSANTGNNRKWWSTTNTNFGEVYEYDYGNKLYFKKTRAVSGYTQMLLLNRYMPNQFDVSFELVSPTDTVTYRHFGIALNHVGSEASNFDYLVLRQRYGNSSINMVRIDRPAGTVGSSQGSSIPNFHDGTKRKIMIQKRASTLRMQVHELNGSVYTYGTISGISWTNSSGYFGFGIYESTGTNTWAEISNLTITDVIA